MLVVSGKNLGCSHGISDVCWGRAHSALPGAPATLTAVKEFRPPSAHDVGTRRLGMEVRQ
jgi:hypothetical protein